MCFTGRKCSYRLLSNLYTTLLIVRAGLTLIIVHRRLEGFVRLYREYGKSHRNHLSSFRYFTTKAMRLTNLRVSVACSS